jgi:hypothetical protein
LNENEDIDIVSLTSDNDNLSLAGTNLDSIATEDTGDDTKILLYDKMALKKAQEFLKTNDDYNKNNNEANINDEDISFDDIDIDDEILETESIISKLTEEEEINYQILSTTDLLTPCVILDIIDGELKCCSKKAARPLAQLIGTWEIKISENILSNMKEENKLHTLGVCSSHYNFDQNALHSTNLKQSRSVENSWIYFRRCLFCNRSKYFFSRGNNCLEHSVCINGRNIQVPCIGLKTCPVFKSNDNDNVINKSNSEYRSRYICSNCFNSQGGHFFERQGKGKKANIFSCEDKHKNDTTKSLEILGRWILNVAATKNEDEKRKLLNKLFPILSTFNSNNQSTSIQPELEVNSPSLFLVKTVLRAGKVDITKIMNKSDDFTVDALKTGEALGTAIWKTRNEVREKKQGLENPNSLDHYRQNFPSLLINFFDGIIITLEKKKLEIVNKKRKQRNLEIKSFDIIHAEKKSTFLASVILTIAFPGLNVWFTHILSSLCRKPKLLSSLYAILYTANVVSHTQFHERRLEKIRIEKSQPEKRLLQGDNIWNISVIDNIDFKEKTFSYGNIFDTTRNSSHATLRMVFQFSLPVPLSFINDNNNNNSNNNNNLILFGESQFTNNLLKIYEEIFNDLLQTSFNNWDMNDIYNKIAEKVPIGCKVSPPNVVILEPGKSPNCDENVHNACDMYFNDVGILNSNHLDIACDEAIFRRLISYNEKKENIRLILGQWHTSKDMCSALITIFSGYGIFNLAANLGVRYLDKLEKVVDYQATCRVLELIWIAVGISISKYLHDKNKKMEDIENENNNMLKVWYKYFCWAGYWFGHKIGIRRGNYDMQFKNLLAFSPLFPVAGKSNYARSVTYFLSYVNNDSALQNLLQHVCSVNLTREGHYFGFDEALERFGVKFVKQNIGGNRMDENNLKAQISSVQDERDRLNILLSEYVGDAILIREERTVKSRKDSLWKLADDLLEAFNLPNPVLHNLFKNTKETNDEGFQRLFSCYNCGVYRLNKILHQDIYKTEAKIVKGRRTRNIVAYKSQNLQIEKQQQTNLRKRRTIAIVKESDNNDNNNDNNEHIKRKHRVTSEIEKEILNPLLLFETFPEHLINNVINQLESKDCTDWDLSRIKKFWFNNNLFKKSKKQN